MVITHPDDVAFVESLTDADVIRLSRMFIRLQSPPQMQLFEVYQDNARANREQRRQYPDHRMNALADIRKALPEEAISYQAIWVWCVKGKVNAKQIDVAWYVEPDGFLSRWESKGFPPLQCPIS
ncbi:hypothetical protein ACVWWO_000455 [Bradyrhizobium sp. F1.13.1]